MIVLYFREFSHVLRVKERNLEKGIQFAFDNAYLKPLDAEIVRSDQEEFLTSGAFNQEVVTFDVPCNPLWQNLLKCLAYHFGEKPVSFPIPNYFLDGWSYTLDDILGEHNLCRLRSYHH